MHDAGVKPVSHGENLINDSDNLIYCIHGYIVSWQHPNIFYVDSNKYMISPSDTATVHNSQHLYLCRVDCVPCRISIIILNMFVFRSLYGEQGALHQRAISVYKLFFRCEEGIRSERASYKESFSLVFYGRGWGWSIFWSRMLLLLPAVFRNYL